ncbi:hypothetical protein FDP41_001721 [Naegleria fowleri]|uniref:Uncharacterized protein n=1 Tax=Naegleria fowleri TaxID=5763 RepID=A0A6A5C0F2_NAEFO|nr:uncharacterized protein FDP41_001721 [Naegleria fowleri]KAF0979378.1 hypothetical protein FDP41_001721 [Naegleria fowleri]CAG4710972.1 unnamed protein product [Naegleria fowleri]
MGQIESKNLESIREQHDQFETIQRQRKHSKSSSTNTEQQQEQPLLADHHSTSLTTTSPSSLFPHPFTSQTKTNETKGCTTSTGQVGGAGGGLFCSPSESSFSELFRGGSSSSSSSTTANSTQFLSLFGHNILNQVHRWEENDDSEDEAISFSSSEKFRILSTPLYASLSNDPSQMSEPKVKLALFGTGGSGKSSLTKLLKLHSMNYVISNFDLRNWRTHLLKNIASSYSILFEVKQALFPHVKFIHPESEIIAQRLIKHDEEKLSVPIEQDVEMAKASLKLWETEPLAQICLYFTNIANKFIPKSMTTVPIHVVRHMNIERFANLLSYYEDILEYDANSDKFAVRDTNHVFTELILSSYIKTTGIIEIWLKGGSDVNDLIGIFDTGGQRNERKKWKRIINGSNPLSGILYLIPLSEFNQFCYEDDMTNRTFESLQLFSEFINDPSVESIPIHVVFTKRNVMDFKLRMYDMRDVSFTNNIQLPEDLKIPMNLNLSHYDHLVNSILKLGEKDLQQLSKQEKQLLELFSSNPYHSPSELIEMLKSEEISNHSHDEEHQKFVEKNIQFLTQQFFNQIQDPIRKEQVIRDFKVIDISQIDETMSTMNQLFQNFLHQ